MKEELFNNELLKDSCYKLKQIFNDLSELGITNIKVSDGPIKLTAVKPKLKIDRKVYNDLMKELDAKWPLLPVTPNPIKEFAGEDYYKLTEDFLKDLKSMIEEENKEKESEKSIEYLNFGQAIEALKEGKKVAREGWNGKGMFIYLNKGSIDGYEFDKLRGKEWPMLIGKVDCNLFEKGDKGTDTRMPNFYISNVDKSYSTWVPSINDCLAEDWLIVE